MSTDDEPQEPSTPGPGRSVSGVFFLIFVLIVFAVFVTLSVVFGTIDRPNGMFAFLFLMAALTVVFVGILGGTGKIEWKWITLGGAPAIYMALIWLLLRPDGGLFTMEDLNKMVNFNVRVQEEVTRRTGDLEAKYVADQAELAADHRSRMDELEAEFAARHDNIMSEQAGRVLFIKFRCHEESIYLSQIQARLQFGDSNYKDEAAYLIPNCDEQDSSQFVVRSIATQAFLAVALARRRACQPAMSFTQCRLV